VSTLLRRPKRTIDFPKSRRQSRPYRPILESLEDRCVPATTNFVQTNLISDIAGVARVTDPNLVNPWGIAYSPTTPGNPGGPFWISDNNAGVSTVYNGDGSTAFPAVKIPPPAGSAPGALGTPTGVVFNGGSGFTVSQNGMSGTSIFIFATEDGTIAGWSPSVNVNSAITAVDNSKNPTAANGAVYKGLAIAGDFLYAADFRHGTIDVFGKDFKKATLKGNFTDPKIPAGFAPFNVQNIGGKLFVTYAKQNATKHDDVAGPGNGFVDVFSTNGILLQHLISHGALDSPWGLAMAPAGFGQFSGDLLVGNFGDGRINAFNPTTGTLIGPLNNQFGNPITIDGLWGLKFGNGGMAGDTKTLFFTAGIGGEQHGLFGSIRVPDADGDASVRASSAQDHSGMGSQSLVTANVSMHENVSAQSSAGVTPSQGLSHQSSSDIGISQSSTGSGAATTQAASSTVTSHKHPGASGMAGVDDFFADHFLFDR
jgi:uncharacterized protein (TIGR03118 family)